MFRWSVGSVLGVVALAVIVLNWQYPVRYAISGKAGSAVPLVGGLLGAVACLILPAASGLRGYWWLPLIIDVGCAGALPLSLLASVVRRLRRRF